MRVGEQLSRGALSLLSEMTAGRIEVRTLEGCNYVRLMQGSRVGWEAMGRGAGTGEVKGGRPWSFLHSLVGRSTDPTGLRTNAMGHLQLGGGQREN